jgi:YjbE family integral membrane protein
LELISLAEFSALVQVILVDLVLAGDNAIVVGMAAAGLPLEQRSRVLFIGIAAATVLRVLFASITVQLLQIIGLVFAGGILLLWVSWKLWRELRQQTSEDAAAENLSRAKRDDPGEPSGPPTKTFRAAVVQIIVADISMSLDNVLAVAGVARDHGWVLIFGLALSVAFMGLAAAVIARVLARHHWVAYIGLAVIFYVAVKMIWDGVGQIVAATV